MNVIKTGILFLTIGSLTIACQEPSKTSDNQEVSATEEASSSGQDAVDGQNYEADDMEQDSENTEAGTDMQNTEAGVQSGSDNNSRERSKKGEFSGREMTGNDIVKNTAGKLVDKLKLDEQQTQKLIEVLTLKYQESGNALTQTHSTEEVKNISRDLQSSAQGEILDILNESQKKQYEKHLNKSRH